MNKEGKYNSVLFARYLIANANERAVPINMTKVQKLLYICYGVYLSARDSRLVNEHPQAWPYGPVFPTTRNKLLKENFYKIRKTDSEFDEIRADTDIAELIDLVFRTYGSWTAAQLSAWSHSNGSPWELTVESKGFKWGQQMNDEQIKDYFTMLIRWEE